MSNSVSEFFSKEGIKKFKNGVKAFSDRQAVKVIAASMVLASAFSVSAHANTMEPQANETVTSYAITEKGDTICSYQAVRKEITSFERLQKLVNDATKSETGRSVLKKMSEQGTILSMDNLAPNMIGFFEPNSNLVYLNPMYGDADLQSCLIHEGKHSIQSHDLNENKDIFHTFASNIMTNRVMEADAMATQAKFSYEMAQKGDSSAWKQLARVHGGVTKAFENGVSEHGQNSNETMKETMLAWYKNRKYVKEYDQFMLQFHKTWVEKASDNLMKDAFLKTILPDSLMKHVCTVDGKPYAGTDGSILQTSETAYLDAYICRQASTIGEKAAKRGNIDTSVDMFYPLEFDGSVSKKTFGQQRAEEKAAEMELDKLLAEIDSIWGQKDRQESLDTLGRSPFLSSKVAFMRIHDAQETQKQPQENLDTLKKDSTLFSKLTSTEAYNKAQAQQDKQTAQGEKKEQSSLFSKLTSTEAYNKAQAQQDKQPDQQAKKEQSSLFSKLTSTKAYNKAQAQQDKQSALSFKIASNSRGKGH